jgi:hypothetical protein
VTLRVVNIEAVVADLKSKGVSITGEIGGDPTFFDKGIKFAFLSGPDGESLFLTEKF